MDLPKIGCTGFTQDFCADGGVTSKSPSSGFRIVVPCYQFLGIDGPAGSVLILSLGR